MQATEVRYVTYHAGKSGFHMTAIHEPTGLRVSGKDRSHWSLKRWLTKRLEQKHTEHLKHT